MNRRSNQGTRRLSVAGMLWMLGRLLLLNNGGVMEELLDTARKQSRPRRWPWQAKTIRDRLGERGEDVADYAKMQGDTLLKIVQEQSHPRRWPWQEKTIRDKIDERSEEFAELAATQSAALAALVAQRRDILQDVVKQTQPRRWPWQQKTARDRLNERSAHLAHIASERSAALATLAATRRDAVLKEARRQTQPRRWPWQEKTVYDRVSAQSERAKQLASEQYEVLADQSEELAAAAAARRDALLKQARRQSKPRRWPWQEKTAYDKATEQYELATERAAALADRSGKALHSSADTAAAYAQQARDAVPGMVGAAGVAALAAKASFKDTASAAGDTLRDTAKNVSSSFGSSSNGAAGALKGTARSISSTAEDAVDAVQSAVNKPVHAVSSGVKATKRTARWSRRVVRTALWAGLAGVVVGMLAAPESGKELRKHLQTVIDQATRTIQGEGGSVAQV